MVARITRASTCAPWPAVAITDRAPALHPDVVVPRRRPILLIALALGLFGCSTGASGLPTGEALAGGEAGGTFALEGPADGAIQHRIAEIYAQLDGLRDVDVRVTAGVVHLRGTTESIADEQRAISIARRIEGVVEVTSDVHAPEQLLATTWRSFRRVARSAFEIVPQLSAASVVFVPFVVLSLLVGRWRRPFHRLGVSQLTGSLVRFALRGALLVTGVLLGLEILGITGVIGAVVGTLGILGLVAGVVFKDWVANYFPSVVLGMHPPFKAGDLVQIGDREGRVIKIAPRATILMTLDGEEVRVPNSALFEEVLLNYSHFRERRLRFVVPLALRADVHAAEELGREALLALRGVMAEPAPFMRVRELGRDRVDVEFFAWIDQDAVNFRTVESRARRAVHEALTAAGIPRPTFKVRAATASNAEELDAAFVQRQTERARAAASSDSDGRTLPEAREHREQ